MVHARGALRLKFSLVSTGFVATLADLCLAMKADIHPKYVEAEVRCACGNSFKTRSTRPVIVVGICNQCHPFYTGQQKFVDTAGRVDKFQQRMAKTQAAQAAQAEAAASKKKRK
jgi:large subunit ribosomal protein L31